MSLTDSLPPSRRNRPNASPRARRALLARGLSAADIRGSGPRGRIIEADVFAFTPATISAPLTPPAARTFSDLRAEIDASQWLCWHARLAPRAEKAGVALSLTDWILCAQIAAFRAVPGANVARQNGETTRLSTKHIGLVVKGNQGIQTLVLRDAARLNLLEMAKRRRQLVDEARAGTLAAQDLGIAATSLHNAGRGRIDELTTRPAPGCSSVLSVGTIKSRPFVVDEELLIRPTLRLCLSVDTGLVDEAVAAQFLEAIIERLEEPALLVL